MLRRAAVIAALAVGPATLGPPTLFAQEALVGRWEGAIDIRGQHLPVAVVFQLTEGGLAATVDMQGRAGVPLLNASYDDFRVTFELVVPGANATFDGEHRGDAITGTFTREDRQGTFALDRLKPVPLDQSHHDNHGGAAHPGISRRRDSRR